MQGRAIHGLQIHSINAQKIILTIPSSYWHNNNQVTRESHLRHITALLVQRFGQVLRDLQVTLLFV